MKTEFTSTIIREFAFRCFEFLFKDKWDELVKDSIATKVGGEELQGFFNVGFRSFYESGLIGVLNAQNERAIMLLGIEIIEQGGSDTTHVQWAGGTRGKTNANRC